VIWRRLQKKPVASEEESKTPVGAE